MNTAFVVDSTGTLSQDLLDQDNIYELTLSTTFPDGTTYTDTRDDKKTIEFYETMTASKDLPTTSQPSPQQYTEILDDIKAKGYEHVIFILLSSKISGALQSAKVVAEDYADDFHTYFIDSKGTSLLIENLVEQGMTLLDEGLDHQTVCDKLRWVAEQTDIFVVVEDLKNLVKGGRLSKGESLMGNLLRIKPILIIDKNGEVKPYEKVRTLNKALKRMEDIVDEKMKLFDDKAKICFAHANREKKVAKEIEKLQVKYPNTSFRSDFLTVILGTHSGEGAIGVGVIPYASKD